LSAPAAFFLAQAHVLEQLHLPSLSHEQLALPHCEHFMAILLIRNTRMGAT